MTFKISGIVSEVQSGLPISRALVVAYDKNVLFDDLLGTAETDADGKFNIAYEMPESREPLFRGPDLYVAVYAPPCQRLVDTSSRIRADASSHEFFNLCVDPDILAECDMNADLDFSADLADAFEWEVG